MMSSYVSLSPAEVRFSQDSIAGRFTNTKFIYLTFEDLLTNRISVDDIEMMEVVRWKDRWWAYTGNRRLYLYRRLHELGVLKTIRVRVRSLDSYSTRATFEKRMTTDCDGRTTRCRQTMVDIELRRLEEKYYPNCRRFTSDKNISSTNLASLRLQESQMRNNVDAITTKTVQPRSSASTFKLFGDGIAEQLYSDWSAAEEPTIRRPRPSLSTNTVQGSIYERQTIHTKQLEESLDFASSPMSVGTRRYFPNELIRINQADNKRQIERSLGQSGYGFDNFKPTTHARGTDVIDLDSLSNYSVFSNYVQDRCQPTKHKSSLNRVDDCLSNGRVSSHRVSTSKIYEPDFEHRLGPRIAKPSRVGITTTSCLSSAAQPRETLETTNPYRRYTAETSQPAGISGAMYRGSTAGMVSSLGGNEIYQRGRADEPKEVVESRTNPRRTTGIESSAAVGRETGFDGPTTSVPRATVGLESMYYKDQSYKLYRRPTAADVTDRAGSSKTSVLSTSGKPAIFEATNYHQLEGTVGYRNTHRRPTAVELTKTAESRTSFRRPTAVEPTETVESGTRPRRTTIIESTATVESGAGPRRTTVIEPTAAVKFETAYRQSQKFEPTETVGNVKINRRSTYFDRNEVAGCRYVVQDEIAGCRSADRRSATACGVETIGSWTAVSPQSSATAPNRTLYPQRTSFKPTERDAYGILKRQTCEPTEAVAFKTTHRPVTTDEPTNTIGYKGLYRGSKTAGAIETAKSRTMIGQPRVLEWTESLESSTSSRRPTTVKPTEIVDAGALSRLSIVCPSTKIVETRTGSGRSHSSAFELASDRSQTTDSGTIRLKTALRPAATVASETPCHQVGYEAWYPRSIAAKPALTDRYSTLNRQPAVAYEAWYPR